MIFILGFGIKRKISKFIKHPRNSLLFTQILFKNFFQINSFNFIRNLAYLTAILLLPNFLKVISINLRFERRDVSLLLQSLDFKVLASFMRQDLLNSIRMPNPLTGVLFG